MAQFEYKVVPAPKRGIKARGVKGTEEQFAHALTLLMNEAAAEGWEYQRTDTLPCEERKGLTGKTTVYQNMLVFRRNLTEAKPQDDATTPALPEASDEAPSIPAPDPRVAASLTR